MCRFSIILSKNGNLTLKDIEYNLWVSSNSIFKQCYKDIYAPNDDDNIRNHKINLDGYGIGFYNDGVPKTYKNINPSWSDTNLLNMLPFVNTNLIMVHIRAINECRNYVSGDNHVDNHYNDTIKQNYLAPVHMYNCHPFTYDKYMFSHNGHLKEFNNGKSRKKLINRISDKFIVNIIGNTDSEYIFYLILTFVFEGFNVVDSIKEAIKFINSLNPDSVFTMNVLFTDGLNIITTRYINNTDHKPPSLYMSNCGEYITISSEPLSKECPSWELVDINKLIQYDSDKNIIMYDL
jgi:predicted glutamine amidotransferase